MKTKISIFTQQSLKSKFPLFIFFRTKLPSSYKLNFKLELNLFLNKKPFTQQNTNIYRHWIKLIESFFFQIKK